jgi:lipopolysaccharide biosynthesis protein
MAAPSSELPQPDKRKIWYRWLHALRGAFSRNSLIARSRLLWRSCVRRYVLDYFAYRDDSGWPVPLLDRGALLHPPVKVIAFYLPQFHPVPENDAWWGSGFTEWAYVSRAVPQFVGHYQPHLPGELGFYDLRLPGVQRRQVELAKIYSVAGFCFYFYWFAGKRLLELPLLNYLADKTLDLPFCLCWANENWTRQWDTLSGDVLIGRRHSPTDDLQFIAYLSRYLRDPRYIRIGGKPLIVIYRPNLLPSMRDTASRWREWCRSNGIGEIFIVYTQSFEAVDPAQYGLDAAIEFPPNNTSPPDIGAEVDLLNPDYAGRVHDWRIFPRRSDAYANPGYPVFRGVCPSWDNEPLRPARGTTFHGSSPSGYLRWLENAALDTVARTDDPSARLVFANAWNAWAEGAHLEPDSRHGYGYLESTRMALLRAAIRLRGKSAPTSGAAARRLAVIVHAFYPDIFRDLSRYFDAFGGEFKLFVTTPPACVDEIRNILSAKRYDHEIIAVVNRGRDVAPFLSLARKAVEERFPLILKLHTKRSPHRPDGPEWRDEIYRHLASPANVNSIIDQILQQPEVGIVGPSGSVVPMQTHWGSNERRVRWLAGRMGIESIDLKNDVFVAGTMFYTRVAALEPLLSLAISADDFEVEQGQLDGTMAHALERAITYSATAAGFSVATVEGSDAGKATIQRFRGPPVRSRRF